MPRRAASRSLTVMRTLAAALAFGLMLLAGPSAMNPASLADAPPVTRGDWHWPVDPPRSVARPFIAPASPYGAGHRGIDVRAPSPTLYAPADGVVHFAGVVVNRPVLSIRHGDGVISSFEPVAAVVAAGDVVTRGQIIGTVVAGHCATACVHVGVRVDGEYVSPLAWFGGIPRSVLLPTRWDATAAARTPRRADGRGVRVSCWCAPRHRPRSRAPATRTSRRG